MLENPPATPEERKKQKEEADLRKKQRKQILSDAKGGTLDPTDYYKGLCFVGEWTEIANLDGQIDGVPVKDYVYNRRDMTKEIPKVVDVGYRVQIVEFQPNGQVVVTSNKKHGRGDGKWTLKLLTSNLKCAYELATELKKAGIPVPSGVPQAGEEPIPAPSEPTPSAAPTPAPVPSEAQNNIRLLRPFAEFPVGTIIPVVGETPQGYLGLFPGYEQPQVFPMSRRGRDYELTGEGGAVPIPTPDAVPEERQRSSAIPRKPWQFVETEDTKSNRDRLFSTQKPSLDKLLPIYNTLREDFSWSNYLDTDVFASIFLLKNSSLVLKGVPGTGKTQLIEMATLMFANDINEPGVNKMVKGDIPGVEYPVDGLAATSETMVEWLMQRGVIGSVKHNPEKEITDIFFYTSINIEKYDKIGGMKAVRKEEDRGLDADTQDVVEETEEMKKDEIKPEPAEAATGLTPPPRRAVPSVFRQDAGSDFENPPEKWGDQYGTAPSEIQVYDIFPKPRPIVYSMIKFHNEANRMNPKVADTLLGLMAEGEVEYQGKKFLSPASWDAKEQKLIWHQGGRDIGSIAFFDYNPHLEVENPAFELDRALLDRITAGFYLSGGSPAMRFKIMDKKSKHIPEPRKVVWQLIKDGKLKPISRRELQDIWLLTSGKEPAISVDAEVLAWIAYFTNLPNLTNRKYGGAYKLDPDFPDESQKPGRPVDRTMTTFKDALEQMDTVQPVTGDVKTSTQTAIDQLERPLGVRSAESLLSLYRAYHLLKIITRTDETGKAIPWSPDDMVIYVRNDDDRMRVFNELTALLPYVLDHRVNLGVGRDIRKEFLSTFDLIKEYFIPLMKERRDDGTDVRQVLFSIMAALMRVYSKNQELLRQVNRKMPDTEKATMFVAALGEELARRAPEVDIESMRERESLIFTLMDLLSEM